MKEVTLCQSCGLPFNEEHIYFIATEQDGSKSIYCTNCYNDENMSMEDLIDTIVPFLEKSLGVGFIYFFVGNKKRYPLINSGYQIIIIS